MGTQTCEDEDVWLFMFSSCSGSFSFMLRSSSSAFMEIAWPEWNDVRRMAQRDLSARETKAQINDTRKSRQKRFPSPRLSLCLGYGDAAVWTLLQARREKLMQECGRLPSSDTSTKAFPPPCTSTCPFIPFCYTRKRLPVVEYFTLASWPSVSGSVSKALVIGKSSLELCGCVGFGFGCGLFGSNGLGILRNIPLDTVILGSRFDQLPCSFTSLLV